jgi:branched-chain amino acid transport system substrate-binding protein
MSNRILFSINSGSFSDGFCVTLHLLEEGQIYRSVSGKLPADLNLFKSYGIFRQEYFCQDKIRSVIPEELFQSVVPEEFCPSIIPEALFRIVVPPNQITHPKGWLDSASDLNTLFQAWLDQLTQSVQLELLYALQRLDPIQFILQIQDVATQDAEILAKLPWHTWHFFQRYQVPSEITLGHLPTPHKYKPLGKVVRILAVLGHSEGINTHHDLQVLRQIWGAWVTPLEQPSRHELTKHLWRQQWDILFFAGHSVSEGSTGRIYINETESLTLKDVQSSLRHAGNSGLKLAIFNSCDGLGLVSALADSGIPWMIVMREPVPDRVAQLFLSYFLEAFSQGKPFLLAVQNARHQLEGIQGEFPCATWIPIVCQSSVATSLVWPQWAVWPNRFATWVHHRLSEIGNWANQWKPLINQKIQRVQNWMITHTKPLRLLFIMMLSLVLTFMLWSKPSPVAKQMSFGESILVTINPDKKLGAEKFSEKNFERAISAFQRSLDRTPDDPEARIYLSNAEIGSNNSVAIAVSVPIGQQPDIAQEILRGVAQAQEELNHNGGIHGMHLRVNIVNDDNDPNLAGKLAQQIVQDSTIIAVVGHNASDVSKRAAKEYQGQLVMISPTSFAKGLTEGTIAATDNYIYRTVPNLEESINKLVIEGIQSSSLQKLAICSDYMSDDNRDYSNEFALQLSKVHKELVYASCNLSDKNLNAQKQVKTALERHAQGLFLAPYVGRIDAALQIAQANQGLQLLGSPTLNTAQTLEKGKAVEGMILAVPWHVDNPSNTFVEKADTLWHSRANLTWRSATAYDATKAIIKGVEQSDGSRTGLQKILSQTKLFTVSGATGEVRFQNNGDRQDSTVTLIQVQRDPQSANGYRFGILNRRKSSGEKILIDENVALTEKKQGVIEYAKENYKNAQIQFERSLKKNSNDPEAMIYFNNAKATFSEKPFKIAVAVPIGGQRGSLNNAQEILRGLAQAQEEFNQNGGISGRLLQVQILDDYGDEETGKSIAESLVNDSAILAVVGHNTSEVSKAAAPIYQKGKLVMVTPTSGTKTLRQESEIFQNVSPDHNYIFRVVPDVTIDAKNLRKIAEKKRLNLLICSDSNSPYSVDILSEFSQFNSGIICNFDKFDPDQIISEAMKQNVNGFMLTPSVSHIEQALKLIKESPQKVVILGGSSTYSPKILSIGDKINGMILGVSWHPDFSSTTRAFAKQAAKIWHGNINWRTAMSYDATQVILEGLRKSPNKTREGLHAELIQNNFFAEGAAGSIEFTPLGDRKSNPNLGILVEAQCKPVGCRFVPWKPQT